MKQFLAYGVHVLLAAGLLASIIAGRKELAYATGLMLVVALVPLALRHYKIFHVPNLFSYFAIFFIFSTIILGEFQNFYERFHWWDSVMHFGSAVVFGVIGFLIMYLFYVTKKLQVPKLLIILFAFAFALSIGALWEIVEFTIDSLTGSNMQVNSLDDTMWDLIIDAAGALIAALGGYLYLLRLPVPFMHDVAEEFAHGNKRVTEEAHV